MTGNIALALAMFLAVGVVYWTNSRRAHTPNRSISSESYAAQLDNFFRAGGIFDDIGNSRAFKSRWVALPGLASFSAFFLVVSVSGLLPVPHAIAAATLFALNSLYCIVQMITWKLIAWGRDAPPSHTSNALSVAAMALAIIASSTMVSSGGIVAVLAIDTFRDSGYVRGATLASLSVLLLYIGPALFRMLERLSLLLERSLRVFPTMQEDILFIRTWGDDNFVVNSFIPGNSSWFSFIPRLRRFEEILTLHAKAEGNRIVAVERPGTVFPTLSTVRVKLEEKDWKHEVLRAAHESKGIFAIAGNTASIKWELGLIQKLGLKRKTTIFIPRLLVDRAIDLYREVADSVDIKPSLRCPDSLIPHLVAIGFTDDGSPCHYFVRDIDWKSHLLAAAHSMQRFDGKIDFDMRTSFGWVGELPSSHPVSTILRSKRTASTEDALHFLEGLGFESPLQEAALRLFVLFDLGIRMDALRFDLSARKDLLLADRKRLEGLLHNIDLGFESHLALLVVWRMPEAVRCHAPAALGTLRVRGKLARSYFVKYHSGKSAIESDDYTSAYKYYTEIAALGAQIDSPTLTQLANLRLSECCIKLERFDEARRLLDEVADMRYSERVYYSKLYPYPLPDKIVSQAYELLWELNVRDSVPAYEMVRATGAWQRFELDERNFRDAAFVAWRLGNYFQSKGENIRAIDSFLRADNLLRECGFARQSDRVAENAVRLAQEERLAKLAFGLIVRRRVQIEASDLLAENHCGKPHMKADSVESANFKLHFSLNLESLKQLMNCDECRLSRADVKTILDVVGLIDCQKSSELAVIDARSRYRVTPSRWSKELLARSLEAHSDTLRSFEELTSFLLAEEALSLRRELYSTGVHLLNSDLHIAQSIARTLSLRLLSAKTRSSRVKEVREFVTRQARSLYADGRVTFASLSALDDVLAIAATYSTGSIGEAPCDGESILEECWSLLGATNPHVAWIQVECVISAVAAALRFGRVSYVIASASLASAFRSAESIPVSGFDFYVRYDLSLRLLEALLSPRMNARRAESPLIAEFDISVHRLALKVERCFPEGVVHDSRFIALLNESAVRVSG